MSTTARSETQATKKVYAAWNDYGNVVRVGSATVIQHGPTELRIQPKDGDDGAFDYRRRIKASQACYTPEDALRAFIKAKKASHSGLCENAKLCASQIDAAERLLAHACGVAPGGEGGGNG